MTEPVYSLPPPAAPGFAIPPSDEESFGVAEPLKRALWREAAIGVALESLAKASGLKPRIVDVPAQVPEAVVDSPVLLDRWVEAMADYLYIEADGVHSPYPDVEEMLASVAPALVQIPTARGTRVLAILKSDRKQLELLGMGGVRVRTSTRFVRNLLVQHLEEAAQPDIDRMLERAQVPENKRDKSRALLFQQTIGGQNVEGVWILRPSPGASLWLQAWRTGIVSRIGIYFLLMIVQMFIGLGSWLLMGAGSMTGRIEISTLQGWALLSLSTVPIGAVDAWLGGRIGVDISALVKRRLLLGALNLSPSFIREKGSGQLLAMIGESQVIESSGFGSVLSAVSALVSLFTAGAILAAGAGGMVHVATLAIWTIVILATTYGLAVRSTEWTLMRMSMTNHLVERMVGHRTRAIQEGARNRHTVEDDELERYLATSRSMDFLSVIVSAIPSNGWLAAGFLGLIPALLHGGVSVASILISVGGLFSAQGAFGALIGSIQGFVAVSVAWRSVGPLFKAAGVRENSGLPNVVVSAAQAEQKADERASTIMGLKPKNEGPILDVRNVSFRYRPGGDPVLHNVQLTLRAGDRVLLEGKSGGGKSTLAAVLAGLQTPESGLVLLRGLDRGAIGVAGWRRRVASAPQFHENHIVTGTLAFNLLLGRRWPATNDDLEEAQRVCDALSLSELLKKMPSGLQQMLGETGWQLSHGEKSRVFLARALLQDADVVLLDESFGALDPLTLKICMDATLARAKTLVVIAHP